MNKIAEPGREGNSTVYMIECPACKYAHSIRVFDEPNPEKHGWSFNGDKRKPTIKPSILVNGSESYPGSIRCHSYVTDGMIEFLDDCSHDMKGKTVPLVDIFDSDI